jgi:RNA polymerase sigma-70 factor (ECF subfamily)
MKGSEHESLDPARHLVWLVDQYERPIYAFLLAIVKCPEVALDISQETFLRAHVALQAGKHVAKAWLFTVARNGAMDHFRRRIHIPLDDATLYSIPDRSPREDTTSVQEVLDHLPALDREVLWLQIVEGFTTDEIGAMFQVRGSAVRQRLYRARERFRQLYAERVEALVLG